MNVGRISVGCIGSLLTTVLVLSVISPDCPLVARGVMRGHTFVGEVKFVDNSYFDTGRVSLRPDPSDAVEPGQAVTVKFNGRTAVVEADESGCGFHDGSDGRYVKVGR